MNIGEVYDAEFDRARAGRVRSNHRHTGPPPPNESVRRQRIIVR
jgi:hypothetical protein